MQNTRLRRLRIDRLDLDLRGIAPASAQAVARALGPALARVLAHRHGHIAPAKGIDAGRIDAPASGGAQGIAAGIAQRIAERMQRKEQ